MFSVRRMAILTLGCLLTLSACGDRKSGSAAASGAADKASAVADTGKVLNLYIWSDYLAADTLSKLREANGHQGARRLFRHQ